MEYYCNPCNASSLSANGFPGSATNAWLLSRFYDIPSIANLLRDQLSANHPMSSTDESHFDHIQCHHHQEISHTTSPFFDSHNHFSCHWHSTCSSTPGALRRDERLMHNHQAGLSSPNQLCLGPVRVKLVCGADLLESFATPNLWADEDVSYFILLLSFTLFASSA
ncbi:unnamed protein product [Protopolystoma xenopodis]|uniref:Uncharacterized protein n=1 Tax=Protopolystoma xenopodis TaxID=117903 RepID=A0A3S5B825_9PLAT|nr:unnamed protein product [Protopolystoma xenopodis]